MSFFKNTAQKAFIFVTDADGAAKTGIAATITAKYFKDGTGGGSTSDVNPDELSATYAPGVYCFNISAAECNCDCFILHGFTSTALCTIRPLILYTELYRIKGTVLTDAGNSATSFKISLTSGGVNNFYKDAYLLFTSGALSGQVRKVTAYTGATQIVTCSAFTATPADSVTFLLINQ